MKDSLFKDQSNQKGIKTNSIRKKTYLFQKISFIFGRIYLRFSVYPFPFNHSVHPTYVVGTPPCTTIRKTLYAAVWQCDESFAFSIFALLETSFSPTTDCLLFFYLPLLNTTENRTNVNDIKSSAAVH